MDTLIVTSSIIYCHHVTFTYLPTCSLPPPSFVIAQDEAFLGDAFLFCHTGR
jgi:hypothetical protein